mgnify:FL=1
MKEECISIYANMYNYEVVADIDTIRAYDDYAKNDIIRLQAAIKRMQEYRSKLYEHAQKLATAEYTLQVSIKREKRYYRDNKVYYYINIAKVFPGIGTETILAETYPGTERNKAIARYNELCKQYPQAEHIKSIDKARWEK